MIFHIDCQRSLIQYTTVVSHTNTALSQHEYLMTQWKSLIQPYMPGWQQRRLVIAPQAQQLSSAGQRALRPCTDCTRLQKDGRNRHISPAWSDTETVDFQPWNKNIK